MPTELSGTVDSSPGGSPYLDFTPAANVLPEIPVQVSLVVVSRSTDVVGRRVAAFVVDFIIAYLGSMIFATVLFGSGDLPDALGLLMYFVVVAYKILFETLLRGETPGKMLLKIHVVRETGEPPGFGAIVARNLFLVPGLFLLCIPSLLMAEFSQKRQRLGDIVAKTLVVSKPKSSPPAPAGITRASDIQPTFVVIPPAAISPDRSYVAPDAERQRSTDLRALAIGGTIAAAFYVAAIGFATIQWSTGTSQPKDCCFPDVRSSSWIHNSAGIAFVVLLAILSLVIVPAIVGFVTQSFAWIPLWGGMTFALMIPAWLVGFVIAEAIYADAMIDEVSGASGYWLMIGLFTVPVVAVIPAALGTLAGRATRWSRDRHPKSV